MLNYDKHIIKSGASLKDALKKLNEVPMNLALFVVNSNGQLIGTLTDGDIRRGLLKGISIESTVDDFMFKNFHALYGSPDPRKINRLRAHGIKLLPILDDNNRIIKILDLKVLKTCLPVDAVLMAGGKGERLRPLTEKVPKPMLPLGNKPIIEHNVDHIKKFGITNFYFSINYLGQQIKDYFSNEKFYELNIEYIEEKIPLGTIGSVRLINRYENPYILVMNSDLFTNVDIENMWLAMDEQNAELCVASIPYTVDIPFAILERNKGCVIGLKEKPSNTFYANAGIYLIRKDALRYIPSKKKFNATDLIESIIRNNGKVIDIPITGYWIDIGRHEEYEKAQMIVSHLQKNN